MKYTAFIFLVSLAISCNKIKETNTDLTEVSDSLMGRPKPSNLFDKYPLVTLLRMPSTELGCIFEKELGYHHNLYNCSNKSYINKGDPCNQTTQYYEGFQIGDETTAKIDSSFQHIDLKFEHGNLRQINILLRDSLLINDARKKFLLPIDRVNFPENITEISFGENTYYKNKPTDSNYTKWISLTGFDHMGAAEYGCQ
ncbi:hypothetical protein MUK70_15525 [Dyadobacter chenwenxiniae]|uniref:Lipoprotein n=1 Tax=Dyadobacter chenwenxiniae TaxID=2906456 RepID=A0A9X1PKV4_9BACT|nr:hypothetical protein [Dyadobacter chenwenxiniae]MCF0060651.1 hypothetical protein [Dyadobacter chenwenxiniae]UON80485.1 hypothetical protein MUK70_15525 [Dyadobacter chenwenxiniae]